MWPWLDPGGMLAFASRNQIVPPLHLIGAIDAVVIDVSAVTTMRQSCRFEDALARAPRH